MIYNSFVTKVYQGEIIFNHNHLMKLIKNEDFQTCVYMKTTFFKFNNILEKKQYDFLLKTCSDFINKVGQDNSYTSWIIHNSWFQIYHKGHFHDTHSHSMDKDNWNFIFYLNANKNASDLVVLQPGYPYINEDKRLTIKPKTFLAVAFPGHLPHFVEPNKDDKRIVLSCNVEFNRK